MTPETSLAARIVTKVAKRLGYDITAIRSTRRHKSLVRARKACALALREAGLSYPEIGRVFRQHHTSIMNLVDHERNGARVLVHEDPEFRAAVAAGADR
jgi:chromosomal replication initiation ATPase DnaA